MKIKTFIIVSLITISIALIYGFSKYSFLNEVPSQIEITYSGKPIYEHLPTLYVSSQSQNNFDYQKPLKFKPKNDSVYYVNFDKHITPREFRFYFEYAGEVIKIKKLSYNKDSFGHKFNFVKKIKKSKLTFLETTNDSVTLKVDEHNGYFDSPFIYLYEFDWKSLIYYALILLLINVGITYFLMTFQKINYKTPKLSEITISIFIISIFLPAPLYNISLILMLIINIKSIQPKKIINNKLNLIIISFFCVYLLNNLFLTSDGYRDMHTIERFLPFLFLPIILPNLAKKSYLIFFPISAVVIGIYLLISSLLDVLIQKSLIFLSFGDYTKYLHPVYFSYLLFFSIIYVQITYFKKNKSIIQLILFTFLIFCGSKMVLILTLLFVFANFINNKKGLLYIIPILILIILFSPLKQRFDKVLNFDDLSILSESKIENYNDARINGLSFRIILWRESLKTMKETKDFIFGKGVTRNTNKILEHKLNNLGLIKHKHFNPHNQYIDTFWRTGVIGLFFLVCIPVFGLIYGIRNYDKLLVQFSLFLLVVMFTESVFGRVNGIYFFTTVILLLMNSKKINEDSHSRNKRNTE